MQFSDGMAYSKGKMEEAFRTGGMLDKPYKPSNKTLHVKREDVDLIVRLTAFAFIRLTDLVRRSRSTSWRSRGQKQNMP